MMSESFPSIRVITRLCLFLAIGLDLGRGYAQDSKQKEMPGANVEFSVARFDPQDRPDPGFVVRNAANEVPVVLPMSYIAGPYRAPLRDNLHLDFFKPGGDTPVLSTFVPTDMRKDLLLIFIPVKDSHAILKIHAPRSSIQGGDCHVVNATTADVAIKYGSKDAVLIQPQKAATLHDPAAGESLTLPVIIQRKDGEDWKLVATENWPHDRRFRTFLFIYVSARDNHMTFHGITQRVE